VVERYILGQEPDPAPRKRVAEGMSQHLAPALAGEHQSKSYVNRSGLAGAVRAEKPEYFSALHAQRKTVQSFNLVSPKKAAVFFADVVEFKRSRGRHHLRILPEVPKLPKIAEIGVMARRKLLRAACSFLKSRTK
jgi:hypothetical protein